jgi:hypothetical protein
MAVFLLNHKQTFSDTFMISSVSNKPAAAFSTAVPPTNDTQGVQDL